MQTQDRFVKEEIKQLEAESTRLNNAVASVEGKRPELQDKENEVNRYKGLMHASRMNSILPFEAKFSKREP